MEESDIEWREPPPRGAYSGTSWVVRLTPLLKRPQQWAMVKECESPELASATQQNLNQRKVNIPEPDHEWSFVARGCEVFAVYRGVKPKTPMRKRTRKQVTPARRK